MIKINLLGVVRPAAKPVGPPATVARHVVILVVSLLISGGIVAFLYGYWSRQITALELELKKQKAEQSRLAGIQAENQRYQQQLAALNRRKDTIQMLDSSRAGPVGLMTALGATAIRNNDLYLLTVNPQGDRLALRGQANSVETIADFIATLKRPGSGFDDVQLRQSYQDDQGGRLSYKFNLDLIYRPPAPAAPAAQPATTAATPQRRAGM